MSDPGLNRIINYDKLKLFENQTHAFIFASSLASMLSSKCANLLAFREVARFILGVYISGFTVEYCQTRTVGGVAGLGSGGSSLG